ncbi:MAG: hypothetical protein CM15mP63_5540 [Gammaproteobacteria bacterium]|nr:MAG: hypothetical protein CM15mP63_5540 [Gammaproteobacteria bacterium]
MKSYHKCAFKRCLRKIRTKYRNYTKDILKLKILKLEQIMTRAFKPMPIILDLVQKIFEIIKILFLFMGKSGRKILNDIYKNLELRL